LTGAKTEQKAKKINMATDYLSHISGGGESVSMVNFEEVVVWLENSMLLG